jgi:hypothetical protein
MVHVRKTGVALILVIGVLIFWGPGDGKAFAGQSIGLDKRAVVRMQRLRMQLSSGQETKILEALRELQDLDKNTVSGLMTEILELTRHNSSDVRVAVASVLRNTNDKTALVADALYALLSDKNQNVVGTTLQTLIALRPKLDVETKDRFKKRLATVSASTSGYMQVLAATALLAMDPAGEMPIRQLRTMLAHPDDGVQCASVKALASAGRRIIPVLIEALPDMGTVQYKCNVISTLALLAVEDSGARIEVLKQLRRLSRDEAKPVRDQAMMLIGILEEMQDK